MDGATLRVTWVMKVPSDATAFPALPNAPAAALVSSYEVAATSPSAPPSRYTT
jgi:hypothetical protein